MFHQAVIAQHDHGKQQLVQAARLGRAPRQQRRGLGIEHNEVALAPRLQVASHALQAQRAGRTRRVLPPQLLGDRLRPGLVCPSRPT